MHLRKAIDTSRSRTKRLDLLYSFSWYISPWYISPWSISPWYISFLIKKSSGGSITNETNYQLAEELHKPVNKKFKKEKFIHCLEIIFGV